MLDLNKSDEELKRDAQESEPASKANWAAPIICTLISLYVMQPFKYLFTSPMNALGGLVAIAVVLSVPIIASILVVKYNWLRNWGIVFVVGWLLGNVVLVISSVLLYRSLVNR